MSFKVGDRVKLKGAHHSAPVTLGEIVTITQLDQSDASIFYFNKYHMNMDQFWYGKCSEWEFVTDDFDNNVTQLKLCKGPCAETTLPIDSNARKEYPIYSGPISYFPKALAYVAKVCKIGNDKHNPGQPLHHARGKSGDHADCILRHLIDLSEDAGQGKGRDENGVPQVAYIAWRALALAQEWLEKNDGAPLAPAAKIDKTGDSK